MLNHMFSHNKWLLVPIFRVTAKNESGEGMKPVYYLPLLLALALSACGRSPIPQQMVLGGGGFDLGLGMDGVLGDAGT